LTSKKINMNSDPKQNEKIVSMSSNNSCHIDNDFFDSRMG